MNTYIPTIIHKYDVADFISNTYRQLYFQEAGTFNINGQVVTGVAGLKLDLNTTSVSYISGGTGLYVLGTNCICGGKSPYTGSTSNEYPVGTPYYYGNMNQ